MCCNRHLGVVERGAQDGHGGWHVRLFVRHGYSNHQQVILRVFVVQDEIEFNRTFNGIGLALAANTLHSLPAHTRSHGCGLSVFRREPYVTQLPAVSFVSTLEPSSFL